MRRFLNRWRAWITALMVIGVVLFAAERALEHPTRINYYRVTAPNSIVVGATAGRWTWLTRITSVGETPSSVKILVTTTDVPLPQTALGYPVELTVTLHDPLGNRPVIDGASGETATETRCPPPLFLAPGCGVDGNNR